MTTELKWRESAACLDHDPDLFFPSGMDMEKIEKAVEICGSCSVKDDCLEYAFESNQEYGIWGGYIESDRRQLRKVWLEKLRSRGEL